MKRTVLLFATITTLFSYNVFAHEIHHGELIHHKESATPGAIGSVKTISLKKLPNKLLRFKKTKVMKNQSSLDDFHESINTRILLAPSTVQLGQHDFTALGIVNLANQTLSAQTYTITSELCVIAYDGPYAETANYEPNVCYTTEDVVLLDSYGTIDYVIVPKVNYNFVKPNYNHFLDLTIYVKNNNSLNRYSTSQSEIITVEKDRL